MHYSVALSNIQINISSTLLHVLMNRVENFKLILDFNLLTWLEYSDQIFWLDLNTQVKNSDSNRVLISWVLDLNLSIWLDAISLKIVHLLLLHWRSLTIIEEIHCHFDIVYNIQENLFIYHFSCIKSQFQLKSISRKIFSVIEDSFIAYLKQQSLLETRLETINIEEWYYYYYSRWSRSTWVT